MDDEEIMRRFNESLEEKPKEPVAPYRATTNMNTMISNPSMNVNNPMNINIQNEKPPVDLMKVENKIDNSGNNMPLPPVERAELPPPPPPAPEQVYQNDVTEQYGFTVTPDDDEYKKTVTYISTKPQIKTVSKKKRVPLPKEFKTTLIIGLILLIFILIMPSIYDFIRDLRLKG